MHLGFIKVLNSNEIIATRERKDCRNLLVLNILDRCKNDHRLINIVALQQILNLLSVFKDLKKLQLYFKY